MLPQPKSLAPRKSIYCATIVDRECLAETANYESAALVVVRARVKAVRLTLLALVDAV